MEEKPISNSENSPDSKNSASKPFKFALHIPQRASPTSKPLSPELIKPQENLQYITEFDPNKPAAKTLKIIPRLQNSWLPHSSLSKVEGKVHSPRFEPATNGSANSVEDESLRKLREDIELCPDEDSPDAYESMPVEEFGEALLRGMGWSHGTGIGLNAKGPIAPYEPPRRVGRLGLGAVPEKPLIPEG